jgi:hypothetical protein
MFGRSLSRRILIPLLFAALILFTIHLQITIWFGIIGDIPPPVVWPALFVYLYTTRDWRNRLLWLGFFFIIMTSYSVAIPLYIFLSLLSLGIIIRFTQQRFSAIDTTDLIAFSAISTLAFPLLYAIFSSFSVDHFTYSFWEHFLSLIFTLPFIPAVLFVSKKIDRVLNVDNEGLLLIRI